jgi:hypothetical protein
METSKFLEKQNKDKTEAAFRKLAELKEKKVCGQVVLHLDGSGIVPKVEIKQFI